MKGPTEILNFNQSPNLSNDYSTEIPSKLAEQRLKRRHLIAQSGTSNKKLPLFQQSPTKFSPSRQLPSAHSPFSKQAGQPLSTTRKNTLNSGTFSELPSPSQQTRFSFMHDELSQPDFEKLSQIYENYLRTPQKIQKKQERQENTPTRGRTASRTESPCSSRKKSVEQLIKQKEEKMRKECTFQPKIRPLPKNSSLNYNLNEQNISREERLKQLAKPKNQVQEKRERLRREQEEKARAECTFKPNITRSLSKSKSQSDININQKLYQDGIDSRIQRQRIQRQNQQKIAESFPYQPQVHFTPKQIHTHQNRPPIYKRIFQLQREKQENLKKIRQQSEQNDPDTTFKPQINRNSTQLALKKRRTDQLKKLQTQSEIQSESASELSFKPSAPSKSSKGISEFLQRQKRMQQRLQARRREIQQENQRHSFKPEINRLSDYLAISNKSRNSESFNSKFQRMSKCQSEKRLQKQSKIQVDHFSQFSFEPKINELSKILGRTSSVNQLSSNKQKSTHIRLAEQKAKIQEENCQFKPAVNRKKKFDHVLSGYAQGSDISKTLEEKQREKQEKIYALQQQKEFEEFQTITFKPEFIPQMQVKKNVKIKGMKRFQELQEMAAKMKKEQKEREDKIFLARLKYNPNQLYTVPEPFNLHPSKKEEKMKKGIQEQEVQKPVQK